MNQIQYMSVDPVNSSEFQRLSAMCGTDAEIVEPRDWPRLQREKIRIVIDANTVPKEYQTKLINSMDVRVIGIHGFGLSDSLCSFLARRGIVCSPRLNLRFVQAVLGADEDDQVA